MKTCCQDSPAGLPALITGRHRRPEQRIPTRKEALHLGCSGSSARGRGEPALTLGAAGVSARPACGAAAGGLLTRPPGHRGPGACGNRGVAALPLLLAASFEFRRLGVPLPPHTLNPALAALDGPKEPAQSRRQRSGAVPPGVPPAPPPSTGHVWKKPEGASPQRRGGFLNPPARSLGRRGAPARRPWEPPWPPAGGLRGWSGSEPTRSPGHPGRPSPGRLWPCSLRSPASSLPNVHSAQRSRTPGWGRGASPLSHTHPGPRAALCPLATVTSAVASCLDTESERSQASVQKHGRAHGVQGKATPPATAAVGKKPAHARTRTHAHARTGSRAPPPVCPPGRRKSAVNTLTGDTVPGPRAPLS